MGDALRSYDHYRWAERYARNNNNDKARAHMRRALHYGMSGFGAVGDDGSIKELESALLAGLRSEPANAPLDVSCGRVLGRLTTLDWIDFCVGASGAGEAGEVRALYERARREFDAWHELVPYRFHGLLEIAKSAGHRATEAKELLDKLVASVSATGNANAIAELKDVVGGKTYNAVTTLPLPFGQPAYGPVWLWDTRKLTSLRGAFAYLKESAVIDARLWDTSNVTSMVSAFRACTCQIIGTERWNVGRVTDMKGAFYMCDLNPDIRYWDTSQVTNMESMFEKATAFNQPIGDWNTSKVTSMNKMFRNATAFNQPIGNWDTRNVVDMRDMFEGASSLAPGIVRQFERRAIDAHMKAKSAESSTAREPYAKKPRSNFGARS